jgi:phosphatidylglycerophosphate synthase
MLRRSEPPTRTLGPGARRRHRNRSSILSARKLAAALVGTHGVFGYGGRPMWSEIVAIYRASKKKSDVNWFTEHVARPPAAIVVYFASKTRITPNQLTFLSVVVAAVACAIWVCLPGTIWLVIAVAIFELSFVLDCADGQLARLRQVASPIGHLLDFLMDELKAMLVIASIAVRLWRESGDPRLLLVGLAGLFFLAAGISLTTFVRRPEYAPPAAPGDRPAVRRTLAGQTVGAIEWVARFFVHYPQYIWICALAGRIDVFFWIYVAVNALYLAKTFAAVLVRLGRFAPVAHTPAEAPTPSSSISPAEDSP